MEIIDLSFKGKMTSKYSNMFYQLASSNVKDFDEKVQKLNRKNFDNFFYWFRSPSSRNTLSSPLFHNYISFLFFKSKILTKEVNPNKIIVDSKYLKKKFKLDLAFNNKIKIIYKKNSLNSKYLIFRRLTKEFILRFFQIFLFKIFYYEKNFNKNICLVDLPVFDNKIDNNRFYNNSF